MLHVWGYYLFFFLKKVAIVCNAFSINLADANDVSFSTSTTLR